MSLQAYHVCFLFFMVDCKVLVPIGWQDFMVIWSFSYLKEHGSTSSIKFHSMQELNFFYQHCFGF
jgi:hypothetical protein